jgi:CheY-like chemotaxis protein
MTYSPRTFAEVLYPIRYFPRSPRPFAQIADDQSTQSLASFRPFHTLKKVSGRLARLLHVREKAAPPPKRLLVVDDEESICFSMKEYFTYYGYAVETANDVLQAESMIKTGRYEVIIQDLRMGTTRNTVGLDMIRIAHDVSPETRIVVLTAYGSKEVESDARASGADAFLRKPQPLSQVAQVVKGLLDSPRRRSVPPA